MTDAVIGMGPGEPAGTIPAGSPVALNGTSSNNRILTMNEELNQIFRGRTRNIANEIIRTIADLKEYQPLTVRQVYYQLVAREVIPNSDNEYRTISRVLTKLREEHLVSWGAIEDRSRRMIEKRGISDLESHLIDNMEYLFNRYNRCLVQNQENYVEVWTEKDALAGIIERAVWMFCCRVVVCRGQVSATFLNEYSERAEYAIKRGQNPIILYFGDLDPTGMRIPVTVKKKIWDRHDVNVHVERIALQPEQVHQYKLPFNPDATKKDDPNYKWYCEQGLKDYSVELDALHPEDLIQMIRNGLESYLDMEDMAEQKRIQQREREILQRLKVGFQDLCRDQRLYV